MSGATAGKRHQSSTAFRGAGRHTNRPQQYDPIQILANDVVGLRRAYNELIETVEQLRLDYAIMVLQIEDLHGNKRIRK